MPNATRRQFVQSVAATAAGLSLPRLARAQGPAANSKLSHACIGVGGMMGGYDLGQMAGHDRVNITALCDVDRNILSAAAAHHPGARLYTDWREMLDVEGDRIDSVNITVPDHMHAAIGLAAAQRGKHIYCQKPMCHDVAEVRALTQAVADAGVCSQLGTQHASGTGDRMGVHFIRQGAIGKISRVVLCSNRSGVEAYRPLGPRPDHADPVPDHLDWDLWLGTAPQRPYVNDIYHVHRWRGWLDFGTGWLGDIGCHIFDAPWKALGLTAPTSIVAEDVQQSWIDSPQRRADTWPQGQHVVWKFPGQDNDLIDGDELHVDWYDGGYYPPDDLRAIVLEHEPSYPEEASLFVGETGIMLLRHGGYPTFYPREIMSELERPELPAMSHYGRFVDACLGGEDSNSPFHITGPMAEAILLGTVAVRNPGQTLQWDADQLAITNNDAAQQMLQREYRPGWEA